MDEITLEAQGKMNKSISVFKDTLKTLRTGKANAAMLDGIAIDYYGTMTPINQISSISVPEPRQLLIKPYDKNDAKSIVSAINAANIGINPINEGTTIRLIIPALTEERRKDIVKQSRKYAEDAKVSIRNIRRDYMDFIKDNDDMTEDLQRRVSDEVQKVTDESIKSIDSIATEKEKEIMSL